MVWVWCGYTREEGMYGHRLRMQGRTVTVVGIGTYRRDTIGSILIVTTTMGEGGTTVTETTDRRMMILWMCEWWWWWYGWWW